MKTLRYFVAAFGFAVMVYWVISTFFVFDYLDDKGKTSNYRTRFGTVYYVRATTGGDFLTPKEIESVIGASSGSIPILRVFRAFSVRWNT